MNFLPLLLIALFPLATQAKYSQRAFTTPCQQVELKVIHCKAYDFSNYEHLSEARKKMPNLQFRFSGSLVSGEVLKQGPIKCGKNQKTDFRLYKKQTLRKSFFVKNYSCNSENKTLSLLKPKFFCDTPGTPTIRGCFISSFSKKNDFNYTHLLGK